MGRNRRPHEITSVVSYYFGEKFIITILTTHDLCQPKLIN